ncbi:hypothetical protein M0R04_10770 [Candidatus Dojkabacteria bacterium]|jgi:hypothetical protein|nr:hypothetical protein [Candidatus Dojkabacteria bacterium]
MANLNQGKQVGEPCAYCQQPLEQGKFGAYCKPCYQKYKNSQQATPQPQYVKQQDKPDWEAISRGKVRHGIVCAMLQNGKSYDDIATQLLRFEQLIMNGVTTTGRNPNAEQNFVDEMEELNNLM